jgi:hypothetical protein
MSELDGSHRSHLDLPGSGIREVHITRASDGSTYGSQPPKVRSFGHRRWGAPSSQGRLRDPKGRENVRRRFGRLPPSASLAQGFRGQREPVPGDGGPRRRWAPGLTPTVYSLPRGQSRRGGPGKDKGVDDVSHPTPLGIGNGGRRKLGLGLRSGEAPASMVGSPSGSYRARRSYN